MEEKRKAEALEAVRRGARHGASMPAPGRFKVPGGGRWVQAGEQWIRVVPRVSPGRIDLIARDTQEHRVVTRKRMAAKGLIVLELPEDDQLCGEVVRALWAIGEAP